MYKYSSIYIKDKEAYEWIKRFCREHNISISDLVNQFFRAIMQGSRSISVNAKQTNIQIGALQIAIVQQQQQNININVIRQELVEMLIIVSNAIARGEIHATYSACAEIKKRLQKMLKKLGGVPAGTLLASTL